MISYQELRQIRARSEAGLSRLPVTEEIAGSNPVGPAMKTVHLTVDFFLFWKLESPKSIIFIEILAVFVVFVLNFLVTGVVTLTDFKRHAKLKHNVTYAILI